MKWQVSLCVLLLLGSMLASRAVADDQELLKKLAALDAVYASGVRVSGTIDSRFTHNPELNREIEFRYTMLDGRQALEEREPAPTYQSDVKDPQAFGGSHQLDADGRMNVMATSATVFLFDRDLSGEAMTNSALQVEPSQKSVERDRSFSIWQYPPDNQKNRYYSLRILLTMGRGYSQYIDAIQSVEAEQTPDGEVLRVEATGHCVSPKQGKWKLLVVPGETYLIREAEYFIEGPSEALFKLSNSGVLRHDDLRLAKRGRFQIGPDGVGAVYEVAIKAASLGGNPDLLQMVRDRVADKLPPHSFVEDRRTDPPRTYQIDNEGKIRGDSAAAALVPAAIQSIAQAESRSLNLWYLVIGNVVVLSAILIAMGVFRWRKARN